MVDIDDHSERSAIETVAMKLDRVIGDDGGSEFQPIQVDPELKSEIEEATETQANREASLVEARPPKENEGILAGKRFWQPLYEPQTSSTLGFTKNVSPWYSHEMWYDEGHVRFIFRPPSAPREDDIIGYLRNSYENISIDTPGKQFPEVTVGDYVSGATVRPTREFWFPIKSPLTETTDADPVTDSDPYGDITTSMVVENDYVEGGGRLDASDCRTIVQTMVQPARKCWTQGGRWGKDLHGVADMLKQPDFEAGWDGEVKERKAGQKEKKAAKIIRQQQGMPGFYVDLRVFTISPYPQVAARRAQDVAGKYRDYNQTVTQQALEPVPLTGDQIRDRLVDTANRRHNIDTSERYEPLNPRKFLVNIFGLASLAHLPDEEVNCPAINWTSQQVGPGAPAGTDQVDEVLQRDEQEETGRRQSFDPDEFAEKHGIDDDEPDTSTRIPGLGGSRSDDDADADQPTPNAPGGDLEYRDRSTDHSDASTVATDDDQEEEEDTGWSLF